MPETPVQSVERTGAETPVQSVARTGAETPVLSVARTGAETPVLSVARDDGAETPVLSVARDDGAEAPGAGGAIRIAEHQIITELQELWSDDVVQQFVEKHHHASTELGTPRHDDVAAGADDGGEETEHDDDGEHEGPGRDGMDQMMARQKRELAAQGDAHELALQSYIEQLQMLKRIVHDDMICDSMKRIKAALHGVVMARLSTEMQRLLAKRRAEQQHETARLAACHRREQIVVLQQMRDEYETTGQPLLGAFCRHDIVQPVAQQGLCGSLPAAGKHTYLLVLGCAVADAFGAQVEMLKVMDVCGKQHVLRADEVARVQAAGEYDV